MYRNFIKQSSKVKQNSLRWTILCTFWRDFVYLGVLSFFNDIVFQLGQPFLMGQFLNYFRLVNQTLLMLTELILLKIHNIFFSHFQKMSYSQALMYASCMILCNVLNIFVCNHFVHFASQFGMRVRVAVCSLIYRKALRLSQTALGETSPGKVVNLLTNDVSRFDIVMFFIHSLWESPLLTIIVASLLWFDIGLVRLVGIIVVFTIMPILSKFQWIFGN